MHNQEHWRENVADYLWDTFHRIKYDPFSYISLEIIIWFDIDIYFAFEYYW